MTVTFLVEIELDTLEDLEGLADEIADAVEVVASVVSVKPWSRPTLGIGGDPAAVGPPAGFGAAPAVPPFPFRP